MREEAAVKTCHLYHGETHGIREVMDSVVTLCRAACLMHLV